MIRKSAEYNLPKYVKCTSKLTLSILWDNLSRRNKTMQNLCDGWSSKMGHLYPLQSLEIFWPLKSKTVHYIETSPTDKREVVN